MLSLNFKYWRIIEQLHLKIRFCDLWKVGKPLPMTLHAKNDLGRSLQSNFKFHKYDNYSFISYMYYLFSIPSFLMKIFLTSCLLKASISSP